MKSLFKGPFISKWLVLSMLMLFFSFTYAIAAPEVNVMPDGSTDETAYTWVGNSLTIWGNVRGGAAPYTYEWDINNDGIADYTGAVGNVNDIKCTHAYGAGGTYDAKLTVKDDNNDIGSAVVRIKVLPSVTKEARIELAIEKGLKYLYLNQNSNGSIYYWNYFSSAGTETAAAVLAFENRNHKPCTQDLNMDGVVNAADRALWEKDHIYAELVHKGLDYMISTLTAVAVGTDYDSNGNGVWIADNYGPTGSNRGLYKIGSYMMALVGAGTVASGAPDLVATTGPANVIGKTYSEIVEDMVDYCDYGQYRGTYGSYGVIGGWRYGPNEWPDNSACQWPAIGMEAAEFGWGVSIKQRIKDNNYNWINYSQYFTGVAETAANYGAAGYTGPGTGPALTAAAMCQLSFQGKTKTDLRILAGAKRMNIDKGTGNSYSMYALAKAARIAKVDTNGDDIGDKYSEIEQMNGWDWYDTYSTWLLNNQNGNGYWYNTYYHTFDTAWAIEILTKNVFSLRPIANIVAMPSTTPANSPVAFNISGSFHQDSSRILTDWNIDVDNNGTDDISGSFPVTAPITYAGYPDLGHDYSIVVKLRVTDDIGDVGEKLITVNIASGNVAPVANAGGPYNGIVGEAITFNGSASYDPNEGQSIPGDHIVSWDWDLDGDGQFDDATGEIVQKTWSVPYSGLIGLKVTDDAGLIGTSTVYTQVFVVDLWPENYVLVSRKKISTYVYEYEYKLDMRNRGNAQADNVVCTLDKVPAQIVVVDNDASFGSIPGSSVVTSGDTFKFRQDRRYPVASFQIKWKLEYDDAGGSHVIFVDFPLY